MKTSCIISLALLTAASAATAPQRMRASKIILPSRNLAEDDHGDETHLGMTTTSIEMCMSMDDVGSYADKDGHYEGDGHDHTEDEHDHSEEEEEHYEGDGHDHDHEDEEVTAKAASSASAFVVSGVVSAVGAIGGALALL